MMNFLSQTFNRLTQQTSTCVICTVFNESGINHDAFSYPSIDSPSPSPSTAGSPGVSPSVVIPQQPPGEVCIEIDPDETLEFLWVSIISQDNVVVTNPVFLRYEEGVPRDVFLQQEWAFTTINNAKLSPVGVVHLKNLSSLTEEERNHLLFNKLSAGIPCLFEENSQEYLVAMTPMKIPLFARYPYISQTSELLYLPQLLDTHPLRPNSEFALTWTFHPRFINDAIYHGYFPMSIPLSQSVYAMAIKLSHIECVLKYENLKIEKRTKQKAKKYDVSINQAFEEVVEKCVQVKGENWLCYPLRRSFIEMHHNPSRYKAKLVSFEVWEGDKLVAGELGHVIGTAYTSLTGFYLVKGTGTIQLSLTGQLLHSLGIEIWDFEMSHPYKLHLGAHEIPRAEWQALHHSLRDKPEPCLTMKRTNAHSVLSAYTKPLN